MLTPAHRPATSLVLNAVETCRDGAAALALYKAATAERTPFSVAIMDLTVPGGMGGKEAAEQILAIDPHAC